MDEVAAAEPKALENMTPEEMRIEIAAIKATAETKKLIAELEYLRMNPDGVPEAFVAFSKKDRVKVAPFDGKDFNTFINTLLLVFTGTQKRIADIDGQGHLLEVAPVLMTEAERDLDHQTKLYIVQELVTEEVKKMAQLLSSTSTHDAMVRLFGVYAASCASTIMLAFGQLINIKQIEDESVQTYVARIKAAADHLRSAIPAKKKTLLSFTDELIAMMIMLGALPAYNNVVGAIDVRDDEELSITGVSAVMLRAEKRMESDDQPPIASARKATTVQELQSMQGGQLEQLLALLVKAPAAKPCIVHPKSSHSDDQCFRHEANAANRPPGWKPRQWNNTTASHYASSPRSRQLRHERRVAESKAIAIVIAANRVAPAKAVRHEWRAAPAKVIVTAIPANRAAPAEEENSDAISANRAAPVEEENSDGCIDSGASRNMNHNRSTFTTYTVEQGPDVALGNESLIPSIGIGSSSISSVTGGSMQISNTLHVPDLTQALISVGQITGDGNPILFIDNEAIIYEGDGFVRPTGKVVMTIPKSRDNLYRVSVGRASKSQSKPLDDDYVQANFSKIAAAQFAQRGSVATRDTWHDRLGHLNDPDVRRAEEHCVGMIIKPSPRNHCPCAGCLMGKMQRAPFPSRASKAKKPGELIHGDIKGPIETTGKGGYRYMYPLMNDCTDYAVTFLLRHKSEQTEAFVQYEAMIKAQFGVSISTFQTDNGPEFTCKRFAAHLASKGILHRTNVAGDSESCGKSERLNRTIWEIAETMRHARGLPPSTWPWSVATATRIRNMRPCSSQPDHRTPFEALRGFKPDVHYLRIYGSDVWARTPDKPHRKSLTARARRAVFIGYEDGKASYKLYDVETGRIFFSQDVVFDEGKFTFAWPKEQKHQVEEREEQAEDDGSDDDSDEDCDGHAGRSSSDRDDHGDKTMAEVPPTAVRFTLPLMTETLAPELPVTTDAPAPTVPSRHSTRERQQTKFYVAGQRASTEWAATVDHWVSTPSAPSLSLTNVLSKSGRKRLNHERRMMENRAMSEVIQANKAIARGGASAAAARGEIMWAPAAPHLLPRPSMVGIKAANVPIPKNWKEAMASEYAGHWFDASVAQVATLQKASTRGPVQDLPSGMKSIGCMWEPTVKPRMDSSGYIRKFSMRLCAQGYNQRHGFDYDQTFAPTVSATSIKIMCTLAAQHQLYTRQVDFVAAYLNGVMEHEVYMKQAPGFIDPANPVGVTRLLKAIYGTKQGGTQWHTAAVKLLLELNFTRTIADPCVFILHEENKFMIIGLHTDDALCESNDKLWMDTIIAKMNGEYSLINHGELSRFLGMRFKREGETGAITVDQEEYIDELLERFNMADCNPVDIPHQPGLYFTKGMQPQTDEERAEVAGVPKMELLGALHWLQTMSRVDISVPVNMIAEFAADLGRPHWTGLKRILAYLKGTKSHGIRYERQEDPDPVTSADADWAGDPDTRRSRSGTVITLAGGAVYWSSKRQDFGNIKVALSSTHAEIKSLCSASRTIAWVRLLLTELGFPPSGPSTILEDNRGAKAWAGYRRMDSRTKDIEVQFHYSREAIESGITKIVTCPTKDMPADFLTKPCNRVVFQHNLTLIGFGDTACTA